MSIYTKTGDKGETSLFDGKRVKKYALRVDTYGVFDECVAQISVAQKLVKDKQINSHLLWIEERIFHLNAEIATAENYNELKTKSSLIDVADCHLLESWIDQYQNELPRITNFILPGETLVGAELHVARTICRRGERRLIELSETEKIRSELLQFVNRLSDCLYVFSRVEDAYEKQENLISKVITRYRKEIGCVEKKEVSNFSIVSEVINSCVKQAETLNVAVTITLVNTNGLVIASFSMPSSLLVSREISFKKAYSAIGMKTRTENLQELTKPGGDFFQLETMTDGKLVTFGGGIPIKNQDDQFVGAIGVSGGSTKEDIQIAEKGLQKVRELGYAK